MAYAWKQFNLAFQKYYSLQHYQKEQNLFPNGAMDSATMFTYFQATFNFTASEVESWEQMFSLWLVRIQNPSNILQSSVK